MATSNRPRSDAGNTRRSSGRSSTHRQSAIIAILLMVIAVLAFIALITYDAGDEARADVHASDVVNHLAGDELAGAKSDRIHNGLGLVGAVLSTTLIRSGFGYAVLILPCALALWAYAILRRDGYGRAVIISNYLLLGMFLVSASFGMLLHWFGNGSLAIEWSGEQGYFMARFLSQLIGRAGGSIVLLAATFITIVFAVDLDVHQTVERLKQLILRFWDFLERQRDAWRERRESAAAETTTREKEVRITRPDDNNDSVEEPVPPPPLVKKPAPVRVTPPPQQPTLTLSVQPTPKEDEESDGAIVRPASASEEIDYVYPSVDLLDAPRAAKEEIDEEELKANADLLRATLAEFDVALDDISVTPGPVVTLYELVPASGVKISRIVSLENDMALKLAARGIRIMAPIPGKSAVGVEIPNSNRSLVTIRSIINSQVFRESSASLPIAMGKTISGEPFADDLAKMPHLLIAGSTGSGKSVGINTILASLLFKMHPSDLKMVLVDPKKIELAQYARLKNHFLAISPDVNEDIITSPTNAVRMLRGVEYEMEKRYDKLAAAGVRNVADYNTKLKNGKLKDTETIHHAKIPFLIVVIDELADLMITAAREVEEPIARLAQLARAVGIHLIVATQRPSVDVITGVIKANFPARVAYQVASKTDSRTILDMNGAEQLLGNGDMLYLASGSPKPVRLQNAYISADEVEALMEHIGAQQGYAQPFTLPSITEKKAAGGAGGGGDRDELFEEAARTIVRYQQGSVSLLQRRLKIGYSRAARLVDELEAAGIVGASDGSKAREVLVQTDAELDMILQG